ncbi:hypothetical protein PRZ48_010619 [Zasmidium cellare]|uniref:Uncharacterized protein n=1 Tax=Zasmidium cellare TaxID=395010 RepID=A0ABR0E9L3_ZASCE|nr:hypothetical protein PRZ48_010619 [Zasmidium cellare]
MALFVKGQEADLELAATCLEAVIASTIRTSASKEEERLEYMRKKPGTRALSWFFSGAFEKHNIVLGQRFMRALVYCMVAEQGMKHLWEWMSIEDMRRFVQSWTLRDASHWRGNLLRYLVESAAHWANEDRPGLEEAMLIFSQAVDRHDPRREPVSLHAARIWLVRQLCVYDLKGVDPRIFDEFVVAAKVSHPEQPQADSAVALLRRWRTQGDQDMGLRVLLADESGNNGKHSVYCFVLRTAQALQSQQKLVEAKEVLNIGRQLLPSYFQGMTP